jgi:hypothetical protein
VEQGAITRAGRGLYRNPAAAVTERDDFAEVARLVPGGIVCLLSALRFHHLTTQNPFEVWLAIDRKAWRPRLEHPPCGLSISRNPPFGTAWRNTVLAASACAYSASPRRCVRACATSLGHTSPRVLGYPREAALAAKLEAMVSLGVTNSRMKDVYDVRRLA